MQTKQTSQSTEGPWFPIKGEELLDMGDIGRCELVEGKLIRMAPTGLVHGITESRIGKILRYFAEEHGIGEVLVGEVGIYTGRDPDTVRGADVVYISHERLASAKTDGFLTVAPELAVEVLSPGDRWSDIQDKLEEYFGIGVMSVWIADPKQKRLLAYTSPTQAKAHAGKDTLKDETVLPGFEIPVSDFFVTL